MLDALSAAAAARRAVTTAWCSWSSSATSARASCPPTSRGVVRRPRRCPTSSCAASAPTWPARAAWRPTSPTWASCPTWPTSLEATFGIDARRSCPGATRPTSTGRSAAADVGRINDLRLGESILLGREPLRRTPDRGPAHRCVHPGGRGDRVEGEAHARRGAARARPRSAAGRPAPDRGDTDRAILALGRQDVDPDGLAPARRHHDPRRQQRPPRRRPGIDTRSPSGAEVAFGLDYGALLRAMTSPFVTKVESGAELPFSVGSDAIR